MAIASNGYLTMNLARGIYVGNGYADRVIRYLVSSGYLEFDSCNYGYFKITEKGFKELLDA